MNPTNGISRAQMSKYDPLTPNAADLLDYQPFYEDRILVKWQAPPNPVGAVVAPTAPSPRDSGPQHGIVVAVGPGNSGIHGFGKGMDADGNPKKTFQRFDFNEVRRFMRNTLGTKDPARIHVPTELKPGDRILYARNPRDEFQRDGETYTFLFEEQHVLVVIE